jgi:signal transduction histidine kinase/pSer/pThr/pTyr-binding forkhead associated (FHA) protein
MDFNGDFAAKAEDCFIRIIAGSLKGKIISVPESVFTLGRASEAGVHIKDKLISRNHCRLSFEDGKWFVEDLGSTNGTWIIGQKVDRKVLLPFRTSARIGKTIFEIVVPGNTTKSSLLDDKSIVHSIPLEQFNMERQSGEYDISSRGKNRMADIFAFQNMISFVLETQELYNKIVESLPVLLPMCSAYLLIFDLEKGQFITAAGWQEEHVDIEEEEIDPNIVSYCKENYQAVLVSGSNPGRVNQSIMCVPMLTREQCNGMLYITLDDPVLQYSCEDLWVVAVAGHTAGMTVQHRNMLEFNFRNERLVATGASAAEISHYIKNILAAMDGSFNLLQMGIDSSDADLSAEAFSILNRNHQRLGNVVLNLLNLASEQKMNFQISDVCKVVRDVVDLMAPNLQSDGINLDVDDDSVNLPLYAEIDANGIHRVLLNLINNAEHAVLQKKTRIDQQNVGKITVRAGFDESRENICISVEDDGVGISPEQAARIFDLFITSKGAAGSGLGLAVSKKIVESHGGKISAIGEKGKGCKVMFSIPVARSDLTTVTCSLNIMNE